MFINLFISNLIIGSLLIGFVTNDKPIISFNVFEKEDTFGQYFAKLLIPSLKIKAETNLTLEKNNDFEDNYQLDVKLEEPFVWEATGVVNTSIDMHLKAKIFDISLQSKTISNFNTRSRTSMSKNINEQTVILTNLTFEDNYSKMRANYNSTLILGQTCPTITLFHNLTTIPDKSLLYFSSNVTEVCDLGTDSSQMSINISLSSFVWQLANAELTQIFNFDNKNEGSETMNATHPLMDISVVADWDRSEPLMHYKKAIFKSKVKQLIPSFQLEFKKYRELPNQFLITIFKEVPNLLNQIQDRVKEEL